MEKKPDTEFEKLEAAAEEAQAPMNTYIKYSSLGFQMIASIGLGAWGGHALDNSLHNTTPWATIGCALLGIAISLFLLFRSIPKS